MKLSLDAFMQKANLTSIEDLKNSIKGGTREVCHTYDGACNEVSKKKKSSKQMINTPEGDIDFVDFDFKISDSFISRESEIAFA